MQRSGNGPMNVLGTLSLTGVVHAASAPSPDLKHARPLSISDVASTHTLALHGNQHTGLLIYTTSTNSVHGHTVSAHTAIQHLLLLRAVPWVIQDVSRNAQNYKSMNGCMVMGQVNEWLHGDGGCRGFPTRSQLGCMPVWVPSTARWCSGSAGAVSVSRWQWQGPGWRPSPAA